MLPVIAIVDDDASVRRTREPYREVRPLDADAILQTICRAVESSTIPRTCNPCMQSVEDDRDQSHRTHVKTTRRLGNAAETRPSREAPPAEHDSASRVANRRQAS